MGYLAEESPSKLQDVVPDWVDLPLRSFCARAGVEGMDNDDGPGVFLVYLIFI